MFEKFKWVIEMNAREIALKTLLDIENGEAYSNLLLNSKLNSVELSDLDKAFVTKLVYGVVTYKRTLDYIISKLSKVKIKKISNPILNILRMGLYQIYYLDKVPDSAVVNESVKLAKRYGHQASANFVNALLRNSTKRQKEEYFKDINDEKERLAIYYSYPEWIIDLYAKRYGIERTENILKANEEIPIDCIRVNTLKITRSKLMEKLDGFDVKEGKTQDIIYTADVKKLIVSDYFKEGLFTVQDEAPNLVGHIIEPKEKEKILDICAAPGGKTTHLAQLANDGADITAFELHEHRCKLIMDLCKRLGINSIKVQQKDATIFDENFAEKFDKIVVDVPCSGLGVIRRKPDIKWNTTADDIENLTEIQYNILVNASAYLKNNGVMVYSTCTNNYSENEGIINKFLKENKGFEISPIDNIPVEFAKEIYNNGMLELFADTNKCDGFFICKLIKTNSFTN